ncbi:MAG TPA: glycosyltransferase [Actinomycetota bacterium]|nr:glycosyltransferase [Actinomycetota bacterium]
MSGEPPPPIVALAERRAAARRRKDFETADALRQELEGSGWSVVDERDGAWRLEAAATPQPTGAIRPADVPSVLHEPPTDDVSVHWVVEGWPGDVVRAIGSFRKHRSEARRVRYVVTDVTGTAPETFAAGERDDVEVLVLEVGTGWGAALNAGIRRATGRIVLLMDGSIEVAGDVIGPLERALGDPDVGIVGPFGLLTHDLREFYEATDPGPCDAIEGYCMALRRDVLVDIEGVDERFRWYRTADIELSFRVKDRGLRTEVVPVPANRHEHRMWFETAPAERAKRSKRNFYRFLDRWRDRWDLVLDPRPPAGT